MAARSFDVVILGGGNAGMGVTVATRDAGLTVAMASLALLPHQSQESTADDDDVTGAGADVLRGASWWNRSPVRTRFRISS